MGVVGSTTLGLLVTSNKDNDTLLVYNLPKGPGGGLDLAGTLGGPASSAPMQFKFSDEAYNGSGYLALTASNGSASSPLLLLVTDAGNDAVHVIDVVAKVHVGYVAAPGSITRPRGVAAHGAMVAITSWKELFSGDHAVHVYEGGGATWAPLRVIAGGYGSPGDMDGQLNAPYGVRFGDDGGEVVVADWFNDRVTIFRTGNGTFVRHAATGVGAPFDVEECEGGWLVACTSSDTVEFVGGDGRGKATLGTSGEFGSPSGLALVPGLGLVVREAGNQRVQVFQ
jgi:hypothetical protein